MRRPRLRTVLLYSNLAVLALPVAGLWGLRLYESALVRQTQSELVAQAAILASVMRQAMHVTLPARDDGPVQPAAAALLLAARHGLDLAVDPVLPPEPDARPAPPADPAALEAGRTLFPVLQDAQTVTLASLRITDRTGTVVASSGADAGRSLAAWSEIEQVLAGEPIVSTLRRREPAGVVPGGISRTSVLRVVVGLPVTDAAGEVIGAVLASRTPPSVIDILEGKWRPLAALAVLLIAIGAALAALVSRLVTRPIAHVVAQAETLAAGGPIAPLLHPGTREVTALSDALGRMAQTLETRAAYIQGFAASVSHEFKTPMAAIQAAAELLDDHASGLTDAERHHLVGLVTDGVSRLALLVRRLVELARADVMRGGLDLAPILVAPVLAQVAARYQDRGMDVDIAREAGAKDAAIRLPPDALDAMLTSLLENADMHAPDAKVRLSVSQDGDTVHIMVADNGPGMPPAHRVRAFEPFFTTARTAGGTGLGLPIVRAIASAAGGTVTILPTGSGTTVAVTLPGVSPRAVLN